MIRGIEESISLANELARSKELFEIASAGKEYIIDYSSVNEWSSCLVSRWTVHDFRCLKENYKTLKLSQLSY